MFNKNIIKKVIGFTIILPFFVYVISQILVSTEELRSFEWHLKAHWILFGISLLVCTNSFACFLWYIIVRHIGVCIDFISTFYIWNISRLGRFIPGNVWQLLGRVHLSKNFNKTLIIWSMGIETAMEVLRGFFCAGIGIIFIGSSVFLFLPKHFPLFIGISIALSLIVLHPRLMKRILAKFLNNREDINAPGFLELSKYFFLYICLWMTQITIFWIIIHGIGIDIKWTYFASAYSISWLLGSIAPFAPGGIGVTEGILTFLLTPVLGSGFASIVSILIRVSGLVGEGITVVIAILVNLKSFKGVINKLNMLFTFNSNRVR